MTVLPYAVHLDARRRYEVASELFVRECFGFPDDYERSDGKDIYPWQSEGFSAYDRLEPRVCIRSGHGIGKTTWLAWLAWHRILWRFPQKTAVTAPSEKQLFDAFWAEFEAWGNRLPPALRDLVEVKADRAELKAAPAESFISIKTARAEQPGALQGLHSTWELVIADEASDVPETVWEAAQSSLTGPHPMAILTGNPLYREGFFHQAFTELTKEKVGPRGWWVRHVSRGEIVDLENDAYAILQEMESGGRHTNRYRIRVLGEPPISEDDVIIPYDLVEPALTRDVTVPKNAPVVWGLDCARFGSNRSALAKRQTQILLEPIRWWAKLDTVELCARVKMEWDSTPEFLRPVVICIDAIGLGGGVADTLKHAGLPVKAINIQELPPLTSVDKYRDLRTELWFKAREWFTRRDCKIPQKYAKHEPGEDFLKELTGETYDFSGGKGKLMALPKDKMHSPDLADAFVLTFAADAVVLAAGRDRVGGKPVERKLVASW